MGAGGTHGELCVRFSSEDLRDPIIKDNLLDDDILREHINNHRLDQWFEAAGRAGKIDYEESVRQEEELHALLAESDSLLETNGEADVEIVPEPAGSDTFEGDTESIADQDRDQDVEMGES